MARACDGCRLDFVVVAGVVEAVFAVLEHDEAALPNLAVPGVAAGS